MKETYHNLVIAIASLYYSKTKEVVNWKVLFETIEELRNKGKIELGNLSSEEFWQSEMPTVCQLVMDRLDDEIEEGNINQESDQISVLKNAFEFVRISTKVDELGIKKLAADYVPPENELNNICYVTMKYAAGWIMRPIDFGVCKKMWEMQERRKGPEGVKAFIEITADYTWDHILGETEQVSVEDIMKYVLPLIDTIYEKMTPEQRQDIGEDRLN